MGEVQSAVTEVAGRGRTAVLLKDGRKKVDALKEHKNGISEAAKLQKGAVKNISAFEKAIEKAKAQIEAGKKAALELKDLTAAHKEATKDHAAATKDFDKHTAAHAKVSAFQPK